MKKHDIRNASDQHLAKLIDFALDASAEVDRGDRATSSEAPVEPPKDSQPPSGARASQTGDRPEDEE